MSLKVWKTSLFKSAAVIHVWKSGAWKTVERASVWKEVGSTSGWRNFFIPGAPPGTPTPPPTTTPPPVPPVVLNVTLNQTSPLTATRQSLVEPSTVTAGPVTASVSNGTGPYTYTWTRESWSAPVAPGIAAPAAATTQLSQNMNYGSATATFKCTVQDSLGNTGSASIQVNFSLIEKDWYVGDNL